MIADLEVTEATAGQVVLEVIPATVETLALADTVVIVAQVVCSSSDGSS